MTNNVLYFLIAFNIALLAAAVATGAWPAAIIHSLVISYLITLLTVA